MITVVGETLVDLVRTTSTTGVPYPGGSPANVAVGLARLDVPTVLLTRLGPDGHGRMLHAHLTHNGVRVAPGSQSATVETSLAEAVVGDDGSAEYRFSVQWDLIASDAHRALVGSADCVHTGSIAAVLEPGARAVRELVTAARRHATVTYDPNCRPSLMGDVEDARPVIECLVAESDVVKVSTDDLHWLYGREDHRLVAARWLGLGPALVIVTRGADGPWALTHQGQVEVHAPAVEVVDTVGAGDAFMSGVLAGLYRHGLLGAARRTALRRTELGPVTALLAHAARVAAITCSRPGADPPTTRELERAAGWCRSCPPSAIRHDPGYPPVA